VDTDISHLQAVLQQAAKERLQLEKRLAASEVRVYCGNVFIGVAVLVDCAVSVRFIWNVLFAHIVAFSLRFYPS